MKTIIMTVVIAVFFVAGLNTHTYAQTYRDRNDRTTVRTHVTIGTPNVRVHYRNYDRPNTYYHHTRYVAPSNTYYYRHQRYMHDRYMHRDRDHDRRY